MAANPTPQQAAAIARQGKVIVSASAGSGKTFVMIERLADYISGGGDLDGVLAVTFTKKAAAQMKEKLRSALIKRAAAAEGAERTRLKEQIGKISSANISTIHSFCGYLLRVYFYLLDIDGSFEIVSDDGGAEAQLRSRAMDALFERLYESEDEDFIYLLERYGKKRSDGSLKRLISDAYDEVRNIPDYAEFLKRTADICDLTAFDGICARLHGYAVQRCQSLASELYDFAAEYPEMPQICRKVMAEILSLLDAVRSQEDIFAPLPKFVTSRRPSVKKGEEPDPVTVDFFTLRDYIKGVYDKLYEGISDRQSELDMFLSSGRSAHAFNNLLLEFDAEYASVKREEGKLDYGDMEHLTLRLLEDGGVLGEIASRFKRVFVDEYQDVNPVQERIISLVGGENLFLVGDVKQAIYGFRGSKSVYFTKKTEEFADFGNSLCLSHNFRSAPRVISAVNAAFSRLMRPETCGIDYAGSSVMTDGGGYPAGSGGAYVHIFGKSEKEKSEADEVYSVEREELKAKPPTREGLAILNIVKRELTSTFFDVEKGETRAVEPGDICILTRKRDNSSVAGIIRALASAGISVSGAQGGNACDSPEVKQVLDILSLIDNGEQDIPFASALISPVGGMDEDELARIKITFVKERSLTFRECCKKYTGAFADGITQKLAAFSKKLEDYRKLAALFGAGTVIDAILRDTALEARYFQDGGKKLKNIRRLAEMAYTPAGELSVGELLTKLKAGGYNLPVAESGGGESVKVMTMHSSKGLEFPVVIIADVTRPYRGNPSGSLLIDEQFGFAHKYFDMEKRVATPTLLGRLCRIANSREEVKNEMNLLYVACTRAKYRLHIMSQERVPFNPHRAATAVNYAQMLDFSCFRVEDAEEADFTPEQPAPTLISKPDEGLLGALRSRFNRPYEFANSIELPVKSSASAVLRMNKQDDYYAENVICPEEEGEARATGSTGAERGTAYHRYLELCDFSVKDEEGIAAELDGMIKKELISPEQAALLNVQSLSKILSMPCFKKTNGAEVFREQEFLCSLPANKFLDTTAGDGVLVQGAIDLMCLTGDECVIIDYKYSSKNDELIRKTYMPQLNIYRLAAERILGIPQAKISAYIVNIFSLREVDMNGEVSV